jgi:acetyl esterase/lipase
VNDSVAAYEWLLGQGYAPENIAIAGDSAGGGLTIATLLALRDRGLPLPATAVPLSPWVDLEGTGDTMKTHRDRDLLVNEVGLKAMADLFLAGGDAHDPLAAPLHADLRGLPPLYIQVGDDETLLDDSRRIAAKATAAGVDVRVDVFPEMQHVFQMGAGNMPEADDAVARIGTYLREHLGKGS